MQLSLKPDYAMSKARYDAFWEQEIIDHPPVSIILPAKNQQPVPTREYASHRERWLDIDFRVEKRSRELENLNFLADALPVVWPDMGPEIFSAWCGCDYIFGADTAWSVPCIEDWARDGAAATFDAEHPLFLKTLEFTKKLLQKGEGKFIVGLTDFHPGGDHLAALRGPERLAVDMIENRHHVKQKLTESYAEFFRVYEIFYDLLSEHNMPLTTWTPLICDGRFYLPSNDFSALISEKMFTEVFLPGIIRECQFYDRSIYHLDGPDALRHLDQILEIKELDAVQWVPGAGNLGFGRWQEVYQKIQQAGKSLQLHDIKVDELSAVFKALAPEGVWFSRIEGIEDKTTAHRVLGRIEKWQ